MDLKEIRWHARGGQGAKTVATYLAECAIEEGQYAQGFPEYGPERMGAPMRGFTRVSTSPINLHSPIIEPTAVVVLDETLLGGDLIEGVTDNSFILVNTKKSAKEVRAILNLKGSKIFTVDATTISIEEIGRPIPNMPMLGALLKIYPVIKKDTLINSFKARFQKKFKEAVIIGNIKAIERAYKEVAGE